MKYVIGLGNPGAKYVGTRHNVGRDMLDELRTQHNFSAWMDDKYANAKRSQGTLADITLDLVAPETYMNNSGETARHLVEKEGVASEDIIVVYDDVDMAIGEVKISVGRGDGGHNGIKSLIQQIGKDFVRVRVGVAGKSFWSGKTVRPRGGEMNRHVLGKFGWGEPRVIKEVTKKVEEMLVVIACDGVEKAMNQCNR